MLYSINRKMEQCLVNEFNNMNIEELLPFVEAPFLQVDNNDGQQQLMGDPEVVYDDDDVIEDPQYDVDSDGDSNGESRLNIVDVVQETSIFDQLEDPVHLEVDPVRMEAPR